MNLFQKLLSIIKQPPPPPEDPETKEANDKFDKKASAAQISADKTPDRT